MTAESDPATVLVIEDDRSLRLALVTTLRAAGYRPVEASTAAEGRRWFAHYKPDLVLLDLGLPDQDGLEVIRTIRGDHTTPIVVLSARDAEAMKVRALDLGADDYVTKPFGVDELLARLRAALRHGIQIRGSAPIVRTSDLEVDLGGRLSLGHKKSLRSFCLARVPLISESRSSADVAALSRGPAGACRKHRKTASTSRCYRANS